MVTALHFCSSLKIYLNNICVQKNLEIKRKEHLEMYFVNKELFGHIRTFWSKWFEGESWESYFENAELADRK